MTKCVQVHDYNSTQKGDDVSMRIANGLTRNAISKLVTAILRKKTEYDVEILINEMNVSLSDGRARVHMNVYGDISQEDLAKVIKKIFP